MSTTPGCTMCKHPDAPSSTRSAPSHTLSCTEHHTEKTRKLHTKLHQSPHPAAPSTTPSCSAHLTCWSQASRLSSSSFCAGTVAGWSCWEPSCKNCTVPTVHTVIKGQQGEDYTDCRGQGGEARSHLLQPLASSHCLVDVSSAEQEEEEGDV